MAALPAALSRVSSVAPCRRSSSLKSNEVLEPDPAIPRTDFSRDHLGHSHCRDLLPTLRPVHFRIAPVVLFDVFDSATVGDRRSTLPDTQHLRGRGLRCYTPRWFCPGDSAHRLRTSRPETRLTTQAREPHV